MGGPWEDYQQREEKGPWEDFSSPAPEKPKSTGREVYEETTKGLSRGGYDTLGSPVDIINQVLSVMGLGTEKPVLGSKWMKEKMQDVTGENLAMSDNAGLLSKILGYTGEYAPSMFIPLPKSTGMNSLQKGARSLYQSGLKPAAGEGRAATKKAVDTLVKNRIAYTDEGLGKLESMITGLSNQADNIVASVASKDIPATQIINEVRSLKQGVKASPLRAELEKGIDDLASRMEQNIGRNVNNMAPLTPAQRTTTIGELNRMKKWIYDKYRSYYGAETPPLQAEGHMAAARGARAAIEKEAPAVRDVNRQLGDLLEARGYVDRATGRLANYEPIGGLDLWAADALTGGGGPAAATAFATRLSRMAPVRSQASFLLDALGSSPTLQGTGDLLKRLMILEALKSSGRQ